MVSSHVRIHRYEKKSEVSVVVSISIVMILRQSFAFALLVSECVRNNVFI